MQIDKLLMPCRCSYVHLCLVAPFYVHVFDPTKLGIYNKIYKYLTYFSTMFYGIFIFYGDILYHLIYKK